MRRRFVLEGVAGEPVALHALLELAYEQFVASSSAVGFLIEALLVRTPDVGYDEPDVELARRGVFHLDHHPLREEPLASPVVELPVCPHRVMVQTMVVPDPLNGGLRDGVVLQHAIFLARPVMKSTRRSCSMAQSISLCEQKWLS